MSDPGSVEPLFVSLRTTAGLTSNNSDPFCQLLHHLNAILNVRAAGGSSSSEMYKAAVGELLECIARNERSMYGDANNIAFLNFAKSFAALAESSTNSMFDPLSIHCATASEASPTAAPPKLHPVSRNIYQMLHDDREYDQKRGVPPALTKKKIKTEEPSLEDDVIEIPPPPAKIVKEEPLSEDDLTVEEAPPRKKRVKSSEELSSSLVVDAHHSRAKPSKAHKRLDDYVVKVVKSAVGLEMAELGGMKFAAVRSYKGQTYVDIREYFIDRKDGERHPHKKGVALTPEQYGELKKTIGYLDGKLAGF